ncbi:hypothetical protein EFL95_05580 [Nocardioides marmorisolisilvae]|uniref:Uncharacterized protein n=1 Tax=Nocardioides marmorisolisilvae TaxID=1542737 RepID=A0A3N0DSG2_9ACTN|nr:hypothetical protein EFL95_05580 [Nocardioides marmorisolisilvae]
MRDSGPYEVGKDIEPGVWITSDPGECLGYVARTRDFDIEGSGDPDDYVGGAVLVGDVHRIVLHRGEFFFADRCSWSRAEASDRTPDPATTAGACAILVGKGDLVQRTLDFGHRAQGDRDDRTTWELQERLSAVVMSQTKKLWSPAGQLVDYLDDPDGYNDGAGTIPKVTRAVDLIRSVCGRS